MFFGFFLLFIFVISEAKSRKRVKSEKDHFDEHYTGFVLLAFMIFLVLFIPVFLFIFRLITDPGLPQLLITSRRNLMKQLFGNLSDKKTR